MSIVHTHLTETRVRLTTSPVIRTFSVIEERSGLDYGYLRVRVELVNQDFLELAEYFVVRNDAVEVKRYRYQWMDSTQQTLRKRWDNANHHPELPNFPHHVHEGDEANVAPGVMLQIVDLIVLLEQALGG
jgi:hypothetical protein